jgi:hypothetical protein
MGMISERVNDDSLLLLPEPQEEQENASAMDEWFFVRTIISSRTIEDPRVEYS